MKLSRSTTTATYIDPKLIQLRRLDEVRIDNFNIVHANVGRSTSWNGFACAAIISELLKGEDIVMTKGCSVKFIEQPNTDWLVCVSDSDTLSNAYALLTHDDMKSILEEASEYIG